MDAALLSLPPLKRLARLMQQLEDNKENLQSSDMQLPTKKRKGPREPLALLSPLSQNFAASSFSMPTKKRVMATPPIDLNLEYNPSFDEDLMDRKGTKDEKAPELDDEIMCAVCQSTDGDAEDPIVFCDGCNLMVHATCYGNPLVEGIPEGDWFCEQCKCSKSKGKIACCLCGGEGGAIKSTSGEDESWAHLVCALYVPEVFFEDPIGREGINYSKVPKRRWLETCYLCKEKRGCMLECSEPNCQLKFHVTCGLRENLCIEYREGRRKKDAIVAGFCKQHTIIWEKVRVSAGSVFCSDEFLSMSQLHKTGKFKIVAR